MSSQARSFALYFDGPFEREVVREAILDLACAVLELEPRPELEARTRTRLTHPQAGSDPHTFRTRYDDGGEVELIEAVDFGSGNPRDGWGYDMSWALHVGDGLSVKVSESDWGPRPKYFNATIVGPGLDLDALDRARAALGPRLGEAGDRCDQLWVAVGNAGRFLNASDEDGARRLLARSVGWDDSSSQYWLERARELCARLGVEPGG